MKIVQATSRDYEKLQEIENKSFGVHIIEKEFDLIVNQGFGEIFFAHDGKNIVGYIAILFREYSQEVEDILQPLLQKAKTSGEKVMHDDVHFDSDNFIYFHLVGVDPSEHNKGIGKELTRFMYERVKSQFPQKQIKVCIRINNLPSIRMFVKELNVCMTSIKPNNLSIIGSVETNFNATTSNKYKAVLEPPEDLPGIYEDLSSHFSENRLLIPVDIGEESDIEDKSPHLLAKLEKIFRDGFIVTGLFRATELGINGKSFFYCEKRS